MVGSFFTMLYAKIAAVVQWFSDLFIAIFVSLWDIFKDIFSWVFDQVMTVVVSAVGLVDVSGLSNIGAAAGSIPANVMTVLSCLGLGQALAMITAALGIRFMLQLIPFVRLGS